MRSLALALYVPASGRTYRTIDGKPVSRFLFSRAEKAGDWSCLQVTKTRTGAAYRKRVTLPDYLNPQGPLACDLRARGVSI